MENGLCIAGRLVDAFEHEVTRGLERDSIVTGCHRFLERIARILAVHFFGHPLHDSHHLIFGDDAVV